MSGGAQAELARLRERVADLAPNVVEEAAERAAPLLGKVTALIELARPLLPLLRRGFEQGRAVGRDLPGRVVPLAEALPAAVPVVRGWRRRSWAFRNRYALGAAGVGILAAGGLAAWYGIASRPSRGAFRPAAGQSGRAFGASDSRSGQPPV